ncbi:hypothetical protein GFL95_14280 [Rhizobium leguminosarum bv. viciae]|uniref:hypothetical protein n=1 Tax=Rhizobium leguminosarum TaxID=384 RepID=UPI0014423794|nr:hypothetical protein [Rhizobium leguminosarum]NKK92383.1 hypothetical protein [Rhizobium leguminosarum bv. viciae]
MGAKEQDETATKGEFAILIGVSPGRVSQYLKEGRISAAAVQGNGRNARIIIERAKADLRVSLDVGQRFGNGLATRLDAATSISSLTKREAELPITSGIDREIKEQKLEQIRRANRNAAISDAMSRGTLMKTDDARAEMSRIAITMLSSMEGKLPEAAAAIAAQFKLPQRDVLHILRTKFRELRGGMAAEIHALAESQPETVETILAIDDAPETLN